MFPLRDENPTIRTPWATYIIIGINICVWLLVEGAGSLPQLAKALCLYSLIPGDLLGTAPIGTVIPITQNLNCVIDQQNTLSTLITHAFLHGGWFHIIANLWFLWVFGDNVEDSMGSGRFVAFYLLCVLAAAAAQIISNPSTVSPMVGASGAIGGVMGAYARLYPKVRVHTLIFIGVFFTTAEIPALIMLGYWFVLQIISGIPAIGGVSGVAFWAHAGGFAAGLFLAEIMHREDYLNQHKRIYPEVNNPE
ncbi:MAG: rhomboid family intramembrane serine protease [Methylobacter sp.]|nr:MAG: rhomboid family intramembrane serine protease [Methylobacter sp.]PPD19032.1 MAG: rhomboid family intramembrane serine protease [Methylobacter sp.]